MNLWAGVEWGKLFGSSTPLLEIVIRGSVMYLALFAVLRVVLNGQAGAVGITDLLMEGDGRISVITQDGERRGGGDRRGA